MHCRWKFCSPEVAIFLFVNNRRFFTSLLSPISKFSTPFLRQFSAFFWALRPLLILLVLFRLLRLPSSSFPARFLCRRKNRTNPHAVSPLFPISRLFQPPAFHPCWSCCCSGPKSRPLFYQGPFFFPFSSVRAVFLHFFLEKSACRAAGVSRNRY